MSKSIDSIAGNKSICTKCKRTGIKTPYKGNICDTCFRLAKLGINSTDEIPWVRCICEPNCPKLIRKYTIKGKLNRYATGHHIKGENNPRYNGYTYTDKDGYVHIRAPSDHPYKDVRGYIYRHRSVIEEHLTKKNGYKTYLEPKFVGHHLNEVKDDDRIENLQILTAEQHNKLRHSTDPNPSKYSCSECSKKKSDNWYHYKDGMICQICYIRIRRNNGGKLV